MLYTIGRSDRRVLRGEVAIDGTHIEFYRPPLGNTVIEGTLPHGAATCTPSLTLCGFEAVDPIALLRRLAAMGALRQTGEVVVEGRKAGVLENHETAGPRD